MHAVRITVISQECVRIEYAPGERFCDYPSLFAIHGPAGDAERAIEPGPDPRSCHTTSAAAGSPPIVIRTSRFTLTYTPDGRPPHAGNMHALIVHPAPPSDLTIRDGRVLWTPESRNLHNLGGTLSTLDGLRGPHPIGEGLLARDGWHVVDDSHRHVLVDGWAATRESVGLAGNTDWYLFAYGNDYAAALQALTIIAGRVPMPRKYALGAWYSRYWPYTSDEFRGIVDEFEVHGFPLDVLVLDMDWHKPGWTGWSWNRELIPDPEDLLSWLHARDLAVTLNLHPADGVAPHEDRYADFMRALGREPDGSTVPFDAGDRTYMRSLFEQIHRPLELAAPSHPTSHIPHPTSGVDFWWVDWQQDKFVRSIPGLTNLRWLNHLYFQHTSRPPAAADPGLRGLSFSRWAGDEGGPESGTEWGSPATGGWGDHRYPIHFSGDSHTGWEMLAFQVPFTAAAGNIGCFFWSHDIGGHFGSRLEEATTRWVQFGALSAALRLHSARTATLDRRPWTYEDRFCNAMRSAFDLRSRLMPYLYTCVYACNSDALPLLRSMYLAHPNTERAYRVPAQYMLGDDLLVAPIVAPGIGEKCVGTQRVWFPSMAQESRPSSGWFNLLTGDRHEPGEEAIVAAPIDQLPIFVRAGVLLPAQPSTHRMATEPLRTLVLHAFPGGPNETCESTLYEDDGITQAHELGEHAITPLTARWSHAEPNGTRTITLNATIGPTHGKFAGQPGRRAIEIHLGGVHRVLSATINGQTTPCSHQPEPLGGLAILAAPESDIHSPMSLQITFSPTDPRLTPHRHRLANLGAAIGEEISTSHLRDAVLAYCSAGPTDAASMIRRSELLAIGAGIGAAFEGDSVRFIDSLGWVDGSQVEAEIFDRTGAGETLLHRCTLKLDPTALHARAASVAIESADLKDPPVGLRASRIARFRFTVHQHPLLIESVARTKLTPLTHFTIAGPFTWDWRSAIVDSSEQPERAPVDRGATYSGRDGRQIGWTQAVPGPKWPVDARASLHDRGALAYAATTLVSPNAQSALLHLSCGDKLEAFINGVKVITLDDHSAHGASSPIAPIALRQGKNELLIKFSDGGGGWGFSASIEGETPLEHAPPA